jgi:long-chain acyl-CoA synthetase
MPAPNALNLAAAFESSVARAPDKTAIYWGDTEFTYRRLLQQSRWLADRLAADFGVSAGDRVGIWLKNCPEFVPALFGILLAGGVVVPINNFLKPDEVAYILSDAGIGVLIVDEETAEAQSRLAASCPGLRFLDVQALKTVSQRIPEGAPGGESTPPSPARAAADLAVIIYTSGTTGRPKGAMLTHGNLLHNVESCRQVLSAVNFDRFVLLLPMFHSFMLTVCVLLPLLVGGSIVLIKSLHPPKNVLHEIIQHSGTVLPAIPQFFRALAHAPPPPNLPLRLCISGAAPLPLETLRLFNERWPVPLIEGYGLSEASPVVSMNPINGVRKPGSIGLPVPGVEVSIQDEDGGLLPAGQVGEICVRGGNVMRGYWNQPEESARALRGGWLLTGDIGYQDADGYIYVTDRKKDMLLVNGINVYPREIEETIYQFPGIKEVAVVGRPDPRKGEMPVAFVSLGDGASLDEKALLQFVRSKLADYKVPRHVAVLAALPRNATGKILKTELRQMASQRWTPA